MNLNEKKIVFDNNKECISGDYNILALDSSSLIRWLYLRSSTLIRFIGAALGDVLAALMQREFLLLLHSSFIIFRMNIVELLIIDLASLVYFLCTD